MPAHSYPYDDDLPVAALRADVKNPRLPQEQPSQREAFASMATEQSDKLLALARHLVEHGVNPTDRLIVIPDGADGFVVLDGNRRLTALRALETPEVVADHLKASAARQLKRLAEMYKKAPVEKVACAVFRDREQADPWIELMHDGESGGAGLVKWSAQQRNRYQSRKGAKPYHLQVLDVVAEQGTLSEETKQKIEGGSYPVSTLKRLLSTPYVRDKLGVAFANDAVQTRLPQAEALKGLSRVVDDIGSGRVKVGKLMKQTQRIDYVNGLDDVDLPDLDLAASKARSLEAPESEPSPTPAPPPKKDRPHSSTRKHLIPREFTVTIEPARINDIYIELKRRLEVQRTPNAVAVLLRVFLELSLDDYLARHSIRPNRRRGLAGKIEAAADHMQQNRVLSSNDLQPIRRAAQARDDANSVRTLHGFVHNRRFSPAPSDLIAIWDTLQIFFEKLWP